MKKIKTLGEFIIDNQQEISYATGELTSLLSSIKLAAKIVHREINKAGLLDLSSINQNQNVHGEIQNNLDIFANETFKDTLKARNQVCGIVSEEEDNVVTFDKQLNVESKYVVLMDPLDGSSNIDVNVSVGSAYTTSNIDEMYNSGTPLSYSEHSTSLQSKFTAFNYLGNWTGNTGQETTDQTGNSNTLTAVGSPTYESELAVECDEDPV